MPADAAQPESEPELDTAPDEAAAEEEHEPLHPLEAVKRKQALRQPPPGQKGLSAHARQGGGPQRSYNRHR